MFKMLYSIKISRGQVGRMTNFEVQTLYIHVGYPSGREILLEFKFCYFAIMANSLNLNSTYIYIFRNLSMIDYIIRFQKSKLLIFCDFDQSEPGR